MEKYKILSGEEIVAKGATKIEVTLPEIGLKDVTPNGSWLEQKQIQSALEGRKHLVEVQRIEKSGVLTHAEWREDLKLAEITQQAGSYWQFLGHHRDNRLYLRPEETLFLMEVNCLLLRYNEVIVSLQQAYSLLLSDEISIIQYKVYASLSRLGYKVFRHFTKSFGNKNNKLSSLIKTCNTANLDNSEKVVSNETTKNSDSSNIMDKESNTFVEKQATKSNLDDFECDNEDTTIIINDSKEGQVCNKESPIIVSNIIKQKNSMEVEVSNSIDCDQESESIKEIPAATGNHDCENNAMVVEASNSIKGDTDTENVEETTIESTENRTKDNGNKTNKAAKDLNISTEKQDEAFSDLSTCMEIDVAKFNSLDCSNTQTQDPSQEQVHEETSDFNSKSPIGSPHQCHSVPDIDPLTKYCQWKLQNLKMRRSNTCPISNVHESFKNCPDISESQIITVNTPKEELLPKNIFLNNLHYVINVENVRSKNVKPTSTDSAYSLSDEANGAHIRRVTNASTQMHMSSRPQQQAHQNSGFPQFFPSFRPNVPFRHYNYWRPPRPHSSYVQFNLFFQRPFMSHFHPRFQFFPRMHIPMFPRHFSNPMDFNINNERDFPRNNRKRSKNQAKVLYLENLKHFAVRLKQLHLSGNMRGQNVEAIESLINTYNERFRARIRLSEQYEIVNDETIVDTITLDDEDEESRVKRPRLDDNPDFFVENLNNIRQTALKLRKLEAENKSTARHRRALSGVIKTFNKYFNADIHMTDNYEVLDRRHINLDSSSDSDCVVEEVPKVKSGKKLRNPFNILKKLSEKQVSASTTVPSSSSTSRHDSSHKPLVAIESPDSYEVLQKTFKKVWLPDKNDFGRPEILPRDTMTARIIETKKEEFLYDFLKDQPYKFNNWLDIKIAFLESIEETNAILHTGAMIEHNIDMKSLVKPDECTDMATVLHKLSIIKSNKNIRDKSIFSIDYDVYNRDVKNFRKANRPKPHFRVVCIDESSDCPSGADIATIQANIEDNVAVIFAIVGVGSISYMQMKPTDLPIYMPCNDLG